MRVLKSFVEQLFIVMAVGCGIYGMYLFGQLDEKIILENTIHPETEDHRGHPRLPLVLGENLRASVPPGHWLYESYKAMEETGGY